MTTYAICVCTRNRKDGLRRLLSSLGQLNIPDNVMVRLILVENDSVMNSESIVKEFASETKFELRYFLESKAGLAYARNRSVKEAGDVDFCCFVDDDQVVDPDWLMELIRCQMEFKSDGVWGSNPPVFSKKVPSFIRKFHSPKPFSYGETVESAFTNSMMIRKSCLDKIEGPFDHRLNFCGGEDKYMTFLVTKAGGVIRCNQNAKAFEIIPEERTTIRFVLKRTYRIANAGIYIRFLQYPGLSNRKVIPRLLMRLCYGSLILIPCYLFGKENKLLGVIKVVNAYGGLAAILGKRNEFYK